MNEANKGEGEKESEGQNKKTRGMIIIALEIKNEDAARKA